MRKGSPMDLYASRPVLPVHVSASVPKPSDLLLNVVGENVGIALRGLDAGVSQLLLHRTEVALLLVEFSRIAVAAMSPET